MLYKNIYRYSNSEETAVETMEKSNTYLANKQNAEQGKAVLKALEEETKRPMEE